MPAPMAPIEPSAQSKSTHSTLVRPSIPNASPLATPSARRPLAISSTAFAAAAQDIAVHSPSCSVRYAVPSRVAARRQSSAIVFVPAARSTSTATERIVIRRKRPRQGEKPGSLYTLETSMRTIWNGSITFGLVNIPVGLALATRPAARQSDVSFRTLHRECGTPIQQKRWCPVHDREVGRDELVKGWEVAKGEFVMIEDADLEAIAQYDDSRAIEIQTFVPLDLARQVIDSLAGDFDPDTLVSEYRQDLRAMLEAKLAGEEIKKPEPVEATPVVDLMDALRKSVDEAQKKKAPARGKAKSASGSRK